MVISGVGRGVADVRRESTVNVVINRRGALALATLGVLTMGVGVSAGAQDPAVPTPTPPPAADTPPAPAAPASDAFAFNGKSGIISWVVKASETEAFELVWTVIRGRLAASKDPDLRAMEASLTIFRMEDAEGQDATYLFLAHPAAKASYSVSPFLLYASGLFERPEADELFETLQKATIRVNPVAVESINPSPPA
jgi:hypothetical protein